jgi:uncharacterized membrane protein
MPNHIRAYRIILTGASVWCALIILPPVLALFHQPVAAICYKFFFPICHQDPARSLFVMGKQWAVCIRCTSIYFGYFLGLLIFPVAAGAIRIPPRILWLCAILPMVLDVFLDFEGIHFSTNVTRLITGGIFGIIAAQVLTPLMIDAISQLVFRSSDYRISHEP